MYLSEQFVRRCLLFVWSQRFHCVNIEPPCDLDHCLYTMFDGLQVVLDHTSYYMNISDANLSNKPKWQLEYMAKASGAHTNL